MTRPSRLAAAVLTALLLLAAGCGVSSNDEPQAIAPENVPFGLLDPELPTTSTTLPAEETRDFPIYLVESGDPPKLIAVERPVSVGATADEVLNALLDAEPTEEEQERDLVNSIPQGTRLADAPALDESSSVLTIDLSSDFNAIRGPALMRAFAQIVFTAVELNGVERVRFEIEGEQIPVTIGDLTAKTEPVRKADYPALIDTSA